MCASCTCTKCMKQSAKEEEANGHSTTQHTWRLHCVRTAAGRTVRNETGIMCATICVSSQPALEAALRRVIKAKRYACDSPCACGLHGFCCCCLLVYTFSAQWGELVWRESKNVLHGLSVFRRSPFRHRNNVMRRCLFHFTRQPAMWPCSWLRLRHTDAEGKAW